MPTKCIQLLGSLGSLGLIEREAFAHVSSFRADPRGRVTISVTHIFVVVAIAASPGAFFVAWNTAIPRYPGLPRVRPSPDHLEAGLPTEATQSLGPKNMLVAYRGIRHTITHTHRETFANTVCTWRVAALIVLARQSGPFVVSLCIYFLFKASPSHSPARTPKRP